MTRPAQATERDRIIEAFIEIVAERGYEKTSLEAVVDHADVDGEAFHHYFEDKAACFAAAWNSVSESYMPRALAAYEGASGWREQMRAVGQAMLAHLTEHPDHGRILFVEGPEPGEPARTPLDPNVEVFIELIDRGRQEMEDPDLLTRATAEGIAGAVNERIAECLKRGADDELPRLVPELMYLVVRPYLGAEVAAEELHRGID